jgi:cobalt/nickel transport system permease protein
VGHGFIDRHSGGASPVHRLDPRAKLLLAAAFVVTVVSTPPPHLPAFAAYAGLVAWACALARVPLHSLLFRALGVLPFSVWAALWMPFLGQGETVSLLGGSVELSVDGLWIFAGVAMKSLLGAATMIWLVATTPFPRLLLGFRKLGAPSIVVDLLALMHRYLFVLIGEAVRLRRAAAARGYRPRWIGQALLIGRLVGRLFVRAFERAERVYAAMVLRGFTGRMPASSPLRFRPVDAVTLCVCVPALVAVRVFLR